MTPIELLARYMERFHTQLKIAPYKEKGSALFSIQPFGNHADLDDGFPDKTEIILPHECGRLQGKNIITSLFEDYANDGHLGVYFLMEGNGEKLATQIADISRKGIRSADFHDRLIASLVLNAKAIGQKAASNELHFPQLLVPHISEHHLDAECLERKMYLPPVKEPVIICICDERERYLLHEQRLVP